MNFDKIVIHFENCETAVIPQKDIISITLKGITRNYSFRNEKHRSVTASNEYETADYIGITLASTANDVENMQPLFERIKTHDDIVSIGFHKDNKNICTVEAPWGVVEFDSYSNILQNSTESDGNLRITIMA